MSGTVPFPTQPAVSAELQDALRDGGEPAIQIVLNAALASNDVRVIAFCLHMLRALRQEVAEG